MFENTAPVQQNEGVLGGPRRPPGGPCAKTLHLCSRMRVHGRLVSRASSEGSEGSEASRVNICIYIYIYTDI